MSKQKIFSFKKYFAKSHPKDGTTFQSVSIKEELVESLKRRGYLIKDVRLIDTVTITCLAAKANVPKNVREALQAKIDATEEPPQNIWKLSD